MARRKRDIIRNYTGKFSREEVIYRILKAFIKGRDR